MRCAYTQVSLSFIALRAFRVYLFRANAAVSRSDKMADQRFLPRVLTAARWADFQAGASFSICFRPLAVIANSTSRPRPPPLTRTKPSRCNGRRFRTSVVRSIPSQSLNSAMVQLSLVFNDSKIDPCVGRKLRHSPRHPTQVEAHAVFHRRHIQFFWHLDVYIHNLIDPVNLYFGGLCRVAGSVPKLNSSAATPCW